MTQQGQNEKKAVGLIIFAIVCLVNPTVKVVDIFPDFIACFILTKYLAYPAVRSPYFEEARLAFSRLALLSILKLPAYYLITFARSNNVQDYDTGALVTLVFTVIEAALLFSAVNNIFSAIFYLGERADAPSLITPFPLNRKKTRFMPVESLKRLSFVFVTVKALACFLPEMLLLTQSTDPGIHLQIFRPMRYYPYAIILAVAATLIFSIIYAKRACALVRTVAAEGKLRSAIDSLADETRLIEIRGKEKIRAVSSTLFLFTVSAALSFELCFDNFGGINLLPHFIYGALIIASLISAKGHTRVHPVCYVTAALYTLVAAVTYFTTVSFVDSYGYSELVDSAAAKNAYLPVIICSIIEFALLVVMLVLVGTVIRRIALVHAGADESSPNYSETDRRYNKKMSLGVRVLTALGIFAGLTKLADAVFKYFSTLKLVATDGGIGNVVMGLIPWFNTVIFIAALAYFGYTLYFLSSIKEDVELKYS